LSPSCIFWSLAGHKEPPNKTTLSNEVSIGKQVWMTQNLDVDKFRNGDPIPHAKTAGKLLEVIDNL